jgi:hypothetical protein
VIILPPTNTTDAVSISSIIDVALSPIFKTAFVASPAEFLMVVCLVSFTTFEMDSFSL